MYLPAKFKSLTDAARESRLILPEEPGEEEPMPDNPAFDAMAEWNRALRRLAEE
jgi:hypothetical protein